MTESANKEINRIQKRLLPFFFKSATKKVYLFGSYSKGSQTRQSDVDLMIVAETDKRFFKRYDDYESVLKLLDDRSVDMLIYTSDELASISHRPFIKKILEEGHIIYEC